MCEYENDYFDFKTIENGIIYNHYFDVQQKKFIKEIYEGWSINRMVVFLYQCVQKQQDLIDNLNDQISVLKKV